MLAQGFNEGRSRGLDIFPSGLLSAKFNKDKISRKWNPFLVSFPLLL